MHRLPHQRMIGNLDVARVIFQAADRLGKHGGQQIVGAEPLQVRRHPLAALLPQHGQRPRHVPAPADLEHRRGQQGLLQQPGHVLGVEHPEQVVDRKAVLRPEREHDAVVVGAGLQLEIEAAAESLAQRQAPGPIDPRARTARESPAACRPIRRRTARRRFCSAWAPCRRRPVARRHSASACSAGPLRRRRTRLAARPAPIVGSRRSPAHRVGQVARAVAKARPTTRACGPGASPSQKGMVGGAPSASRTATSPPRTYCTRHEVLPSRNTSPARLSMAKSSLTVPTNVPSPSVTTRYSAVSGIAPPEVIAASRAPRRGRSRPLIRSRCR